jgi:hypothetical protein
VTTDEWIKDAQFTVPTPPDGPPYNAAPMTVVTVAAVREHIHRLLGVVRFKYNEAQTTGEFERWLDQRIEELR